VNWFHSGDLKLPDDIAPLYLYLKANRKILEITKAKKEWLHIHPHEVLEKIHHNDPEWETMVPKYVSDAIKHKKLFGYMAEKSLPRSK